MPIKLNTASGGGVILTGANTASDKTITVPASDGTMVLTGVSGNVDINAAGSNYLTLSTNTTERARITSGGNLLIGSSTASSGYSRVSLVGGESTGSGANSGIQFTYNASTFGGGAITTINAAGGGMDFFTFTGNVGSESYTGRMRIDSSGNFYVGTTTSRSSYITTVCDSTYNGVTVTADVTSARTACSFRNPNGAVGSITTSGTATAYNTSSDYRLKENVQPMTGALAKISALKPCTYVWKTDGSAGEGFIAHELAEVVPGCVTGEKDAIDADGSPVYQGIDTSFLVATLAAAIQEQQQMIETLQAKVAALEAK